MTPTLISIVPNILTAHFLRPRHSRHRNITLRRTDDVKFQRHSQTTEQGEPRRVEFDANRGVGARNR